jgi:hypothetical protein
MYSLTQAGDIFLSGWIDVLSNYQKAFRSALERMNPELAVDAEVEEQAAGA